MIKNDQVYIHKYKYKWPPKRWIHIRVNQILTIRQIEGKNILPIILPPKNRPKL